MEWLYLSSGGGTGIIAIGCAPSVIVSLVKDGQWIRVLHVSQQACQWGQSVSNAYFCCFSSRVLPFFRCYSDFLLCHQVIHVVRSRRPRGSFLLLLHSNPEQNMTLLLVPACWMLSPGLFCRILITLSLFYSRLIQSSHALEDYSYLF